MTVPGCGGRDQNGSVFNVVQFGISRGAANNTLCVDPGEATPERSLNQPHSFAPSVRVSAKEMVDCLGTPHVLEHLGPLALWLRLHSTNPHQPVSTSQVRRSHGPVNRSATAVWRHTHPAAQATGGWRWYLSSPHVRQARTHTSWNEPSPMCRASGPRHTYACLRCFRGRSARFPHLTGFGLINGNMAAMKSIAKPLSPQAVPRGAARPGSGPARHRSVPGPHRPQ